MGAVYLAEDSRLSNRSCAVKEMRPDPSATAAEQLQAQQQFQQEAGILALLKHPNLPGVYDHFSERGNFYLVMEYVEGETLDHLLSSAAGFLLESLVRHWSLQLCDVLDYLHCHRPPVIFRDLKPANIMLARDGTVKLIDFGIARIFDPRKKTDTLKMGTVGYAPPEQYAGHGQTDARSDIYALGATLHHLTTKQDPTSRPFVFSVPSSVNPAVSPNMDHVIAKALELDPDQRFQTVQEMKAALTGAMAKATAIPLWRKIARYAALVATAIVFLVVGIVLSRLVFGGPRSTPTPGPTRVAAVATSSPTRAPGVSLSPTLRLTTAAPVAAPGIATPTPTPARTGTRPPSATPVPPIGITPVSPSAGVTASPPAPLPAITPPRVETITAAVAGRLKLLWRRGIGAITEVAWSPDGRLLALAAADGAVLFDGQTLAAVRLMNPTAGVSSLAFSPDGERLATAGYDKAVRLWDVAGWQQKAILTGHKGYISKVAFSPAGQYLATGSGYNEYAVGLWDVNSSQQVALLSGHPSTVQSVVFNPAGTLLASGSSDGLVRLWDVASRQAITQLTYPGSYCLAFSPDGQWLAGGSGAAVRMLNVAAPQQAITLTGHLDTVLAVAFSPDGQWLASGGGSNDKMVRLWKTPRGPQVDQLAGHDGALNSVAFSRDGRLVSAGADQTVRLWDVAGKKQTAQLRLGGHNSNVTGVDFGPGGQYLASASLDGTVRLWNTASGEELALLVKNVNNSIYSMAVSSNGQWLALTLSDKTVRLWDLADRREVLQLAPVALMYSVAFSRDSQFMALGGEDQTVRLWDMAGKKEVAQLTGHTGSVRSVAFSPDGKLLASASADKTVRLWDVAGKKETAQLARHQDVVNAVAFSPDGKWLASASADKTVRVWDVASKQPMILLTGHTQAVSSIVFSPGSDLLASGGGSKDDTIRLWEVANGQPVTSLTGHSEGVLSLAFSPDGKLLASGGGDDIVRLWGVPSD
jgi:WD40 repeat protein